MTGETVGCHLGTAVLHAPVVVLHVCPLILVRYAQLVSLWNPDGLLWLHAGFDTLSHIKELNICCAPAVNCHPDLPSIK